jgi:DNA-binding Lrp family transcriptional regulator
MALRAYFLVKVEVGKDKEVFAEIQNLQRIYRVREVASVFGVYDLVVKIEAEAHKDLETVVFDALRQIPGVRETVTLVVVKSSEE